MGWLDWSRIQNDITKARQDAKRERERVEQELALERQRAQQRIERDRQREEHLSSLVEQLERRVASASDPRTAVRSFIEGDVYALDDDARQERDRIAQLQFLLGEKQTELIKLKPEFERAWLAREEGIAKGETVAKYGTREQFVDKPGVGSVILATAVLIGLETFLLRHPVDRLTLNIAPTLGSGSTISLLFTVGLVVFSTAALLFAARNWGEYSSAVDRADPTAVNAEGVTVGEDVPVLVPWVSTIVAVVLQVVLFYLRFQTGTTNQSTSQGLIAASVMVMVGSAVVGLLEYRYARAIATIRSQGSRTRGDDIIERFLRLHREVTSEIPRSVNEAKRLRLQALERYSRDFQRVAELKGSAIQQAITELINEVDKEIEAIPEVVFEAPPIPTGPAGP